MIQLTTPVDGPRVLPAKKFIEIVKGIDKAFRGSYRHPDRRFYWLDFDDGIIISGIQVDEEIHLNDDFYYTFPILIKDAVFNNSFIISGGIFKKQFLIVDGNFNGTRTGGSLEINGGIFEKRFGIAGGTFNNFCVLRGIVEFQSQFWITGGIFNKYCGIQRGIFKGYSDISGGDFLDVFELKGGEFFENFKIDSTYRKIFFEKIRFEFGRSPAPVIIIKNESNKLTVNCVEIIDVTLASNIIWQFINVKVNKLFIQALYNYGNISFHRLKFAPIYKLIHEPISDKNGVVVNKTAIVKQAKQNICNPKLCIHDTDIGHSTFISCDLSEFEFNFRSSKLTNISLTGTQMPEKITTQKVKSGYLTSSLRLALGARAPASQRRQRLFVDSIQEDYLPRLLRPLPKKHREDDWQQRRLGYSQIKKIYEAQGDVVNTDKYFSEEMKAYAKTFGGWEGIGEKFILNLNRISTDFGLNWQKGLFVTLLVSGLFFGFYILSLGIYPSTSVSLFLKIWSFWIEFINPIHDAGFVAEALSKEKELSTVKETAASRFIEGISRIFIAYFIYQFIQAFRKHGKKGG